MDLKNMIHNRLIQQYDEKIKKWSRTTEDGKIEGKYFAVNNSDDENTNKYNREMDGIKFILYFENQSKVNKRKFTRKEIQQAKEFFILRAKLWDGFRREGIRFSKEKLILLATLERVADGFYQKNRGIVELGRINAELGIITENENQIFPEYARISKLIEKEKFYEKRRQEEIRESEERNLKAYRERVQRNRAEKVAVVENSSGVKATVSSAEKTAKSRIPRGEDR